MAHQLPALLYDYNALEPHIDARTMEIHHTKHHQAYIDKLNAAIAGTEWEGRDVEELLRSIESVPEQIRTAVRNHGGGHANHSLFWTILTPNAQQPSEHLERMLTDAFGSVQDFKTQFSERATTRFGSGWAWLVVENDTLKLTDTANQDSPLMHGATPVLGLDVWEHAYYLHYQNRRPEYVAAFWSVVHWAEVERRIHEALGI